MQLIKLMIASLLIPVGFGCLLAIATALMNPNSTPDSQLSIVLGSLIIGIPALGIGGSIAWNWYRRQSHKVNARSRRIRAIFFHLIHENQGKITATQFAHYTHLSLQDAQKFLNQKTKELNGISEQEPNGDIQYDFKI